MEQITREILWNIPDWLVVAMYVLTFGATAFSAWKFYQRCNIWRHGRPEHRWEKPGERLKGILRFALGYDRHDPYATVMHLLILWGFIILFIGTVLVFLEYDTPLHFFYGPFYLIASLMVDLGGVAFMAGISMGLYRRYIRRKDRLENKPEHLLILLTLLIIGVTGFLVEGSRIAATGMPSFEVWSVVGYSLGAFMRVLAGPDTLQGFHRFIWGFHMVTTGFFFAILALTVLRHMFTSAASIFFRREKPLTPLKPIRDLETTEHIGVATLQDFTWKDLLDADACTTCGRCHEVCPARISGKPLDPRQIVLKLQSLIDQETNRFRISDFSFHNPQSAIRTPLYELITPDEIWACTTCGACNFVCPVNIEIYDKIIDLRRHLVEEGEVSGTWTTCLEGLEFRGNPWQNPGAERARWAESEHVKILQPGEQAKIVYWVGCAGAYDPNAQKISRTVTQLLKKAGIDPVILGNRERCTGDPARRLGEEALYQHLARENVRTLKEHGVRKIITSCPHCFHTFKNEYPQFGADFEVVHHSELVVELVDQHRLEFKRERQGPVTFHDPCYLGRYNGIFDAPRKVLNALANAQLIEMERSREKSFCCGGGGGQMWLDLRIGERVENVRFKDVEKTGAKVVATACPYCKIMMQAAVDSKGVSGQIQVKDIAEIALEAL